MYILSFITLVTKTFLCLFNVLHFLLILSLRRNLLSSNENIETIREY